MNVDYVNTTPPLVIRLDAQSDSGRVVNPPQSLLVVNNNPPGGRNNVPLEADRGVSAALRRC